MIHSTHHKLWAYGLETKTKMHSLKKEQYNTCYAEGLDMWNGQDIVREKAD